MKINNKEIYRDCGQRGGVSCLGWRRGACGWAGRAAWTSSRRCRSAAAAVGTTARPRAWPTSATASWAHSRPCPPREACFALLVLWLLLLWFLTHWRPLPTAWSHSLQCRVCSRHCVGVCFTRSLSKGAWGSRARGQLRREETAGDEAEPTDRDSGHVRRVCPAFVARGVSAPEEGRQAEVGA